MLQQTRFAICREVSSVRSRHELTVLGGTAHESIRTSHNSYFQAKLAFLVLAGINMSIFHWFVGRDIERWGIPPQATPLPARIAGAVSLVLWIGVVAFGRWVGFSLHP